MGFFQANIWKASALRGFVSLFKTQERTIKCVLVSETGVVSLDSLVVATGYCLNEAQRMAWAVLHRLKMPMEGVDEPVLPISERSCIPLDPLGRMTKEELDVLRPLNEIAAVKYHEAFARTTEDKESHGEILKTLAMVAVIGAFIVAVIVMVKS